jgi:phosphatidylserine/phosphatidylglycerophosphate/cardiolipin synthase-like enzyme
VRARLLGLGAALSALCIAIPASAASSNYALQTEPDENYQSVYDFIASAKSTIDMTMYELVDTTTVTALENAAARGVTVRVILDQNREQANNQSAYDTLNANGVTVVWANATFAATHQKTITVDGLDSAIMTGNLTSRYYSTSRDYVVYDSDSNDVDAIEKVFEADYAGTSITPGDGDDLVWSPTDSSTQLLGLINNATSTLTIENEEMAYTPIVTALVNAAKRGVIVKVIMTDNTSYHTNFDTLVAAGVQVSTYVSTASLYIHAKVIDADGSKVFIGSENFSTYSLTKNRELGLITTDASILYSIGTTLAGDFDGTTVYA